MECVKEPDTEDAGLNPGLALAHAKWIENIRFAYEKKKTTRLDLMMAQYTRWCETNKTKERDPQLYDIESDGKLNEVTIAYCFSQKF